MKTGKIRIKHMSIILLVAAAIISICTLGISRQAAVNSEISKYDNTELTSLILAYDNDGNEISPKKIDEQTYDGYTFKLKSDTPDKYTTEEAIKNLGIKEIGGDNFYSAKTLEAIDEFISEEYIEYIEPDYTVTVSDNFYTEENVADPNDVSDKQWNLAMMKVQEAWSKGVYGQPMYDRKNDVTVAVIDSGLYGSGVDDTEKHEDIDYGKVVSGTNLATSAKGTPDTLGHGTFVSGMIFAKMNNNVGIAGIASEVKILPIKVFGSSGRTSNSTVESAIYEAVDKGADVINMSLGAAGYSASLKSACDAAEAAGILVVAAAGNDGTSVNNYPAAYDSVVGVASVDSDRGTSYFSQYGDSVDVAAPGGSVYSLGLGASSYKSGSGTSYASPEVAALAAMVKSIMPEMTQTGFQKLLEETSQDEGAEGFDKYYGWGIVDFGSAVTSVLEQKYLPIYNIQLDITDENRNKISDADVTVKAAEDISWEDDESNNISAGTWKKGTVINPENGIYKLHKGEYSYIVSREGYRTVESTFVTYMKDQTVSVALEKTYSVSVVPQDSEGNILDESVIKLTRKGDGLEINITQNSSGRYQCLIPAGTYDYSVDAAGYVTMQGALEIATENQQKKLITLYERKQLCNVIFECKNENNEILEDINIVISDGENNRITAQDDGTYMLVKGREYVCIASKAGYEEEILRFKAGNSDAAKQEIDLKEVDRTAEFEIKDSSGNTLEGAVVTLKDNNGKVMEPFKADRFKYNVQRDAEYSYTISCNGFADKNGSFKADKSRVLTIVMEDKKTEVTFEIKGNEETTLTDVKLSVYGEDGKLYRSVGNKYFLPCGNYTYSVAAESYQAVNGSFNVTADTDSVEIPMTPQIAGAETEFAGGEGTAANPYLIATQDQFEAFAANTRLSDGVEKTTEGYYRLLCDVTLTENWSSIGGYKDGDCYNIFCGSFDGGGHTVTISSTKYDDGSIATGLFGAVESAKISNITVEGTVTGNKYVGGIVGLVFYHTDKTVIENCANKAKIKATSFAGGIAGYVSATANAKVNVYIESCSNSGVINATGNCAGGIIGAGRAMRIASCYNRGSVTGEYDAGGIQGSASANTYTYSCYNTGEIKQTAASGTSHYGKAGAITGSSSGNYGSIYYLNGTATSAIGVSTNVVMDYYKKKTDGEMKTADFVDLLNIRNEEDRGDFVFSEGDYPLLKWQQQETAKLYAEQPAITTQPADSKCEIGEDSRLEVVANASDGGSLTYQWYANHTADTEYAQKIENAKSENYIPDTSAEGTMYYYVVVTNTITKGGKTATNRTRSRFVKIETVSGQMASAPQITEVTGGGTFEIGEEAELGVAVNSPASGNLTYQWYRSKYADTKGQAIADANEAAYTAANEAAGTWYYYAAITNTEGDSSKTVNSERVRVEVKSKDIPVTPPSGGGGGGGALPLPSAEEKTPIITVETGTEDKVSQVKVPEDKISEAIGSLTGSKGDITIEVSDKKDLDEMNLEIDMKSAEKLAQKLKGTLITKVADVELVFSKEALENIVKQADEKTETITIIIRKVSADAADGNGELIQLEVKAGDSIIYDFGGKVYVKSEMTTVYSNKNGILQLTGSEFSDVNSIDNPAVVAPAKTDVKALIKEMRIKTSVKKTGRRNIRVKATADVSEIKAAGYTVKYRYYRSVKKSSLYKAMKTKKTTTYINTTGKKGTKYYYKVRIYVYDDGKLVCKTALKQSNAAAIRK